MIGPEHERAQNGSGDFHDAVVVEFAAGMKACSGSCASRAHRPPRPLPRSRSCSQTVNRSSSTSRPTSRAPGMGSDLSRPPNADNRGAAGALDSHPRSRRGEAQPQRPGNVGTDRADRGCRIRTLRGCRHRAVRATMPAHRYGPGWVQEASSELRRASRTSVGCA